MLGFKRKNKEEKNNEQSVALIERKESIFSKILSFFRRKKEEEIFFGQDFYSIHSYIKSMTNNAGEELYDVTVNLNENESYFLNQIKEIGLLKNKDKEATKIIIANYKKESNVEREEEFLRKICFEIPNYYSLEEFLVNDGLYELVKTGNLQFDNLNYYKINLVGMAKMEPNDEGKIQISIVDNTQSAIDYVNNKLLEKWLKQISKDRKEKEKAKKQEDIEKIYNAPQTSSAFTAEKEKQENRINDNNIRVAPGKGAIYFTDPDNGKTVYLDDLTKVNSVVHNNDNISNLYVTNYTSKKDYPGKGPVDDKQQFAFELTDDDMNELLKNDDESLNLAFRTLFSETNVDQYKDSKELGNRHIGYLKKTIEGYKILIGCKNSKNFLNSLKNLSKYNMLNKTEGPISVDSDESK